MWYGQLVQKPVVAYFVFALFCLSGNEALKSLKCFRCIALDCPEEAEFCNEVRTFVLNQLPDLYYVENNLPNCPQPTGEDDAWAALQRSYPSSVSCGAIQENEATCALGRFQVITNIISTDTNVTSHGTVLGCARRKLLESTTTKVKYFEPQKDHGTSKNTSIEKISTIDKCSTVTAKSNTLDGFSLRHHMQLEHCAKYTDMCYNDNFCVLPETSVVKPFQDQSNGVYIPMIIFFIFAAVLGLFVCALTFLGIKYY